MIQLSYSQFQTALGCDFQTAAIWSGPMLAAMERFDITTLPRAVAFLAQVGHESTGLRNLIESLNYKAEALRIVSPWNTRMTAEQAKQYGRIEERGKVVQLANQRMIAEIGYGGRMGNGPVGSGDGFKYRGRGPIMTTGADAYIRAGHMLGYDLLGDPDALTGPKYGSLSAAYFWAAGNRTGRSLNSLADKGNLRDISDIVNGTTGGRANGMADRLARADKIAEIIA